MSVVYVREQGATLRRDGELIRVTLNKRNLFQIPLNDLEQVVLMGNVQITTQAAAMLMRHRVEVVFLDSFGGYRGHYLREGSKFARLRVQQVRMFDDEARALPIARSIVAGKINNQRVIMQRRAEEDGRMRSVVAGMGRMLAQVGSARDLDQLRGFEGKAAAYYFDAMRSFFAPEWEFRERNFHPSRDPANALLSFLYTLVRREVEARLQLVGLDPYLGVLHALGDDKPGLALDMMEEFRPAIADVVALWLVREEQLTPADFERTNLPDLPVRMTKPAIEKTVRTYETRMADKVAHPLANGQTDYRRAIELQARQMARVVKGEAAEYVPLELR